MPFVKCRLGLVNLCSDVIFLCSLQDKQSRSSPAEENVETDLLVQIEQNDVQSAPSEFSTLEIQVSGFA